MCSKTLGTSSKLLVSEKIRLNDTFALLLQIGRNYFLPFFSQPLISYFNHGRLSFPRKNDEMKTLKPFVCFGSRTQDFEIQSTTNTTLRESGAGGHALHMVITAIYYR